MVHRCWSVNLVRDDESRSNRTEEEEASESTESIAAGEGCGNVHCYKIDRDDVVLLASQMSIYHSSCMFPTDMWIRPQVSTAQHTNKHHQMSEGSQVLSRVISFLIFLHIDHVRHLDVIDFVR